MAWMSLPAEETERLASAAEGLCKLSDDPDAFSFWRGVAAAARSALFSQPPTDVEEADGDYHEPRSWTLYCEQEEPGTDGWLKGWWFDAHGPRIPAGQMVRVIEELSAPQQHVEQPEKIESANCGCEYPCSCVTFRGKRYRSRDDVIADLASREYRG